MNDTPPPRLRADAARNSERIVAAAHAAFGRGGLDVQLEEIAAEAGVSIATLYRRFPNKEELVKAVLERQLTHVIGPAIERAEREEDPRKAVVMALEAMLTVASREQRTLAVANDAGAMSVELAQRFFESLAGLVRRAQDAGTIRADLSPLDIPRIILMLVSTLASFEPDSDGWRRYLGLLLDGLSPAQPSELPPPEPLREHKLPFDNRR